MAVGLATVECGCADKASGFFLNSLACMFRESVETGDPSMQSSKCLPFSSLPRAAGILSWESPIIRADPLIPHPSPSPHLCKRNTLLEKSLHGRGILPCWGLLHHCPNYSHSKHWAWLHFISLHRFLRCSGGCGSCDLSSARASGTIEAVSEGFPEDTGGEGGRRWQLCQWSINEYLF